MAVVRSVISGLVALLLLSGGLSAPTLYGQAPGRLQYFLADPPFALRYGCTYSAISGQPKLIAYLEAPDSVSPELRSACDVIQWFGKPGRIQSNEDASLAETWFYFLRRDYNFTLTLYPATGNQWQLAHPLVLGFGHQPSDSR